jgi:amino acid permease
MLTVIGILAGATIGAGVFSLPYIATLTGWPVFFIYLAVLGVFVGGAHLLYWKVLAADGTEVHLVGLSKKYLGPGLARLALIIVLFGLLFTLSIYILLGGRFLARVFPLSLDLAYIVFWLAVSIPLVMNLRRFIRVELFVTALMVIAVLTIVFTQHFSIQSLPTSLHTDLFFPFAPILFALAGWTALEPMVARYRQLSPSSSPKRGPGAGAIIAIGTLSIAVIYALFAIGIASVSTQATADTFSGLGVLPPWYLVLLFIFGLCAIVTSYLPMSQELRNALVSDLKWPASLAVPGVLFMPYILILVGLDNLIVLIELVGGVFLSLQYLIILFVARRALQLHGFRRFALDVLAAAFFLAIAYQFYYLLV